MSGRPHRGRSASTSAAWALLVLVASSAGAGATSPVRAGSGAAPLGLATIVDDPTPALYEALRAAELEPVGGLRDATVTFDRFELVVPDAELFLLAPVGGVRTGAVILGKGRVRMDPPNEVERRQLDKYLDEPLLDLEFQSVVLRFTTDMAARLEALASPSPRLDLNEARKIWRDRHEKILDQRLLDVDARVLRDLLDMEAGLDPAGGGYLFADLDAKGWFSIDIDPLNVEEVRVYKAFDLRRAWNNWALFHRLEDYDVPPGTRASRVAGPLRVAEGWAPRIEIPHMALDTTIEGNGDVESVARLRLDAGAPMRAVHLYLSQLLDVSEVRWVDPDDRDDPGSPLEFVQAHVGRGLSEDRWAPRILVALPRTVDAGERFAFEVRYHGELIERLANRDYVNRDPGSVYPDHTDARRTRFDITYRMPDRMRVASGGELISDDVVDGRRVQVHRIAEPVTAMSFHAGELRVDDEERDGMPMRVYSSRHSVGFAPGNRDRTLDDIASAMAMYRDYYGEPPFDRLTLTETPSFGGMSFHTFVLLSFTTFGGMHTGEAELFRTHEIAHQWWGNSLAWDTYRDTWLSEGFSQYSAALHTLVALEDEEEFGRMMSAWRKDILGRGDIGQRFGIRHYGFSPDALRDSEGPETGPIWVGTRLSSDETPLDYRIHVYEKGAYVLHMLRMMLYDWTTGDDFRFKRLMRTFHAAHRGGTASTIDFLEAVEDAFDQDMLWFFDQWVFGHEIPTLNEDLRARRVGNGWRLQGRIRQEDVEHPFRLTLPVRIRYDDGDPEVLQIEIRDAETRVDLPLRAEPDEVEINPLEATLARIR